MPRNATEDSPVNARSRKDARSKLEYLSKAIVTHMLKIILFPHGAVNHWQKELDGMAAILANNNRTKGSTGDNYSEAMFMEYLFDDWTDSLPLGFVQEFESVYGAQAPVAFIGELEKAVRSFYRTVDSLSV